MKDKTKSTVIAINYCVLTLIMLISCIYNNARWLNLMTLYFFLISFYSLNTFFLYDFPSRVKESIKYKIIILMVYFLEVGLIFFISELDLTLISIVLYLFILADIVLNQKLSAGIAAFIILYIISSISILKKLYYDNGKVVASLLFSLAIFIVVYIIFLLINYLLRQNKVIAKALKDITVKKLEKDLMYNDLKIAYERVETMTALKERNRIAREIHDTVGHTLTTVLVEMEASKRLMKKDVELAGEKLNLAQTQVRKGLNDIRSSVRVLENGDAIFDFYSEIQSIISESQKHMGIVIKSQIDENIVLKVQQEKVVLSAFMEGITNGIKHGKSSAILFKLHSKDGKIYFSLEDNGTGADIVTLGFGLRAMKERILELNGNIDISSKSGEGFGIYIVLPIVYKASSKK